MTCKKDQIPFVVGAVVVMIVW